MSPNADHLKRIFKNQIRDAYSAETQLLEALPKLRERTADPALRRLFASHLEQTRGQLTRLGQIAEQLHFNPQGATCRAMQGLIADSLAAIDDTPDPDIRDTEIICAAQKIEHFEMALYSCLFSHAQLLSLEHAIPLLSHTLEQEDEADVRLSEIATDWINERPVPAVA